MGKSGRGKGNGKASVKSWKKRLKYILKKFIITDKESWGHPQGPNEQKWQKRQMSFFEENKHI